MKQGWIKIHRKLLECDIWDSDEPYSRRDAWIELLLLANHSDKEILFDNHMITVQRGQYITSIRKLSTRWHWNKNKVLAYLRLLEECKMIEREADTRRTLITIVNYGIYQAKEEEEGTVTGQQRDSDGTVKGQNRATNKNDKECNKNDKNDKYICAFENFWKFYPKKKDKGTAYKCYQARLNSGYSEEQLLTACKNYAAECEQRKTDQQYIKNGATFLSINEPFLDYLKGEEYGQGDTGNTRESEEERQRGIDEVIRRIESGEADHDDDHLWDGLS